VLYAASLIVNKVSEYDCLGKCRVPKRAEDEPKRMV
jgi:hypothetical protein